MAAQKCFYLIAVTVITITTCMLCGCGYYDNFIERDGIVFAEKKENIFPGLFDTKTFLKKPKLNFIEKDTMFFNFWLQWSKAESLSRILEKTFDIAEKMRHKNDLDLTRYYIFVKYTLLAKVSFSDFKRKLEMLETEYDVLEKYKRKAAKDLIGTVAYLKQTGPAIIWLDNQVRQTAAPFITERHNRYRSAYNFNNTFIPPNSFGWPFNQNKK